MAWTLRNVFQGQQVVSWSTPKARNVFQAVQVLWNEDHYWQAVFTITSHFDAVLGVAPPGKPINPTPADASTGIAVDTSFSWEPGPGGVVDTYAFYFGTSADNLSLVESGITGTTFELPTSLLAYQTYYWRIDATNTAGTTTGDVWSFTTIGEETVYPTPGKLVFNTRYDRYKGMDRELADFLMRWEGDIERDFAEIAKRINWLMDNRFTQSE